MLDLHSLPPTVVLVDDSSTVKVFFEHATDGLDIQLQSFSTADECMGFLEQARPALLFLDIILPGKDGLTFLAELRRDPRTRELPVVVISSKDYAQDRMTARTLGALEFVTKPMSKQSIHDLIVRHTGARTEPPASA